VQQYHLYENWTLRRGRIHRAECSHCNHGRGTHENDSGRNGKWHGPFDRNAAFKAAAAITHADIQPCKVCDP
jgi:hypothetical protein